jgi:hypothetical protein
MSMSRQKLRMGILKSSRRRVGVAVASPRRIFYMVQMELSIFGAPRDSLLMVLSCAGVRLWVPGPSPSPTVPELAEGERGISAHVPVA